MTLILLNALLPIFVGLLLGYIAGRRGVIENLNVRNLIVLVMDFAIPMCPVFHDQQHIVACAPRTIGIRSDAIRDITLVSAIPSGFFGFVFGKSFKSTPETASSGLIASYDVGAFSMAGWMLVLTKYL
jgi:predicted permease